MRKPKRSVRETPAANIAELPARSLAAACGGGWTDASDGDDPPFSGTGGARLVGFTMTPRNLTDG